MMMMMVIMNMKGMMIINMNMNSDNGNDDVVVVVVLPPPTVPVPLSSPAPVVRPPPHFHSDPGAIQLLNLIEQAPELSTLQALVRAAGFDDLYSGSYQWSRFYNCQVYSVCSYIYE
jgi:hypothetical protein